MHLLTNIVIFTINYYLRHNKVTSLNISQFNIINDYKFIVLANKYIILENNKFYIGIAVII